MTVADLEAFDPEAMTAYLRKNLNGTSGRRLSVAPSSSSEYALDIRRSSSTAETTADPSSTEPGIRFNMKEVPTEEGEEFEE